MIVLAVALFLGGQGFFGIDFGSFGRSNNDTTEIANGNSDASDADASREDAAGEETTGAYAASEKLADATAEGETVGGEAVEGDTKTGINTTGAAPANATTTDATKAGATGAGATVSRATLANAATEGAVETQTTYRENKYITATATSASQASDATSPPPETTQPADQEQEQPTTLQATQSTLQSTAQSADQPSSQSEENASTQQTAQQTAQQTTSPPTSSTAQSTEQTTGTIAESSTNESDTTDDAAAALSAASSTSPIADMIICIDPGHQKKQNSELEPVAPGSSTKKAKVSSGTAGIATGEAEYVLNLAVAMKLKALLEADGATVIMIRTSNEVDISNVERAKIGNDAGADLAIRIHADSSTNRDVKGASMLIPSPAYIGDELAAESKAAGQIIMDSVIAATGAKNRGLVVRDDMTGFNWSTVPVILIEMGFMSNPDEDRQLATDEYRSKMAMGLYNGCVAYFGKRQ